MNYICITYVRSRCGNRQLVTAMAFVLGLPAGKDYSVSRVCHDAGRAVYTRTSPPTRPNTADSNMEGYQ